VNPFFGSTDELLAMVVIYLEVVDDVNDRDNCDGDVADSTTIGGDDVIMTMEPC
jgi:hypothetical protein